MTDTRDEAIINGLNATPSNVCMDDDGRAAYFLRTLADAGWIVARLEPTPEMCAKGFAVDEAEHDPAGVYRAMIQAGGSLQRGHDQHGADVV